MAGVELLYKPPKRSVLGLRSNLANDLRQRAISKNREEKNRADVHTSSLRNLGSSSSLPALRTSDLRSQAPTDNVHARIKESVYNAKSALASMKIPDLDVEDVRREYIQKVGQDYSTVGLTSYIIAQKDAKEFRERCFSVLSRRPKGDIQEEQYDTSGSSFFTNRKTVTGRPKTPEDVLLSSCGKVEPLSHFETAGELRYSPVRSHRAYGLVPGSPFADHANVSDHGGTVGSELHSEHRDLTIGSFPSMDNRAYSSPCSRISYHRTTPWSEGTETRTPEQTPMETRKNRRKVVEDILEENKDLIPQDLDVRTLGYTEKRKLLKQLGFEDDYIANRLCDRYITSNKNKNSKLTPLEAFSMYDRQELNESIQVHKDLSVEFSRYKRGTESPIVTFEKPNAPKDVYDTIKAMLES